MSLSECRESSSRPDFNPGIPGLLNKLCYHLARNDAAKASRLFALGMRFLVHSASQHGTGTDEAVKLSIVKKLQELRTEEEVRNFELLHAKLYSGTVLKNKLAVLTFFLSLVSDTDNRRSYFLKELQHLPTSKKALHSLSNSQSKDSVRKIFSGTTINSSTTLGQGSSHLALRTGSTTSTDNSSKQSELRKINVISSMPFGVTESNLLKEVIFSFQGIEGQVLKREPSTSGFVIDSRSGLNKTYKVLIERLTELGYLHNQIKQHCEETDKQTGVIMQSLVSVLREELSEYYRMIALLEGQFKKKDGACVEQSEVTFRRLLIWIVEPHFRLQWLVNILLECQNKRGCAIISSIYKFLQHGSPDLKEIVEHILKAVCTPLYYMLIKWLLDGHLDDTYGEFFIEARMVSKEERMWHDRYHVRTNMLPAFISMDQAQKILATGKSINFLREVCKDLSNLPGREAMHKLFQNTPVEALFLSEQSIDLHSIMDDAYRETSIRVLDIMRDKYKLMDHMLAFRRYMLLGQGDFIRHLMEMIAPELSKPASLIFLHTLHGILESAIRATNAQYEDPDTLKRLDVRMMEISTGDNGWDVFSLLYYTDGPIGTVFEPTLEAYRKLFCALWKAKRMEFVLCSMWRKQITSPKLFADITELRPVLQQIHIITSEMIHFLRQTQYYFLFEVLECSWAEMLNVVNHAESLDVIINAHNKFLTDVQSGTLLDSSSLNLSTQLRIIYNTILKLESTQETLLVAAGAELKAIKAYKHKLSQTSQGEGFSKSTKDELEYRERSCKFSQFLASVKAQIRSIAHQYNEHLKKYLYLLASHPDVSLQLLSVRLDFNDFYKNKDSILLVPLTYRRTSGVMAAASSTATAK